MFFYKLYNIRRKEEKFENLEQFDKYYELICNNSTPVDDETYTKALEFARSYKNFYDESLKSVFVDFYQSYFLHDLDKLEYSNIYEEVNYIFSDDPFKESNLKRLVNIAESVNNWGAKFVLSIYNDSFMNLDYLEKDQEKFLKKYYCYSNQDPIELTPVGFYKTTDDYPYDFFVNYDFISSIGRVQVEEYSYYEEYKTDYVTPQDEKYIYAITNGDYSKNHVDFYLKKTDTYFYEMTNPIYSSVSSYVYMVENFKLIFSIIGSIVGVFAALMLLNFIATSISLKEKEIGILRAVGAKGSDVFKIFYSESGIISIICFILSVIATGLTCYYLNKSISSYVEITILEFGYINILLILAITIFISFIATFFPVLKASKKQPVDSIRSM